MRLSDLLKATVNTRQNQNFNLGLSVFKTCVTSLYYAASTGKKVQREELICPR